MATIPHRAYRNEARNDYNSLSETGVLDDASHTAEVEPQQQCFTCWQYAS
jgi:hypothetical protein